MPDPIVIEVVVETEPTIIEVVVEASPAVVEIAEAPTEVVEVETEAPIQIIEVVETGHQGPPGNAAQAFYHRQIEPALLWVVNHNLGLMPAITAVVSLGGLEILADVQHVSDNQLRVAFVEPTAGQLRCI